MIARTSNSGGPSYQVTCDGCKTSFDADTNSFARVRDALKGRRWRTDRNSLGPPPVAGGFMPPPMSATEYARRPDWLHFCTTCAADRPRPQYVRSGEAR